jgi:tetratricopeptide (TPR) repeat protein
MLGVDEAGQNITERMDRWHNELTARRLVMVFDDVTGPEQVWPLIPEEGDCFVIVTSRHHLGWGTGHVLSLGVLSDEDAATLFVTTAGRVAAAHPGQVAAATKLCGFLPLAISLAAARIRSGEADFDDLLRELKELNSGHGAYSDLGDRLARVFDMTYRRLPAEEQRLFRRLGAGPCVRITPVTAAVLTGTTEAEAQVSLAVLRECHLLEESSGRGYGLHDVIRSYAVARSAREDSRQNTHHAIGQLADHYLSSAIRASQAVQARAQDQDHRGVVSTGRGGDAEAAAWLSAEWDNALRIAEYCGEHGDKRRCVALMLTLTEFLEVSGYWDRSMRAHSTALALSRDTNDQQSTAMIAFALSLMCLRTGQFGAALEYASEAATAYAEAGDQNGRALALDRIGIVHRHASRFRESLAYHREAMDIFHGTGDRRGTAKALLHAAAALFALGRHAEQMSYLTEAFEIFRQEGDLRGQGLALNNIGLLQHIQGYHRGAVRSYHKAREIFSGIGGRQNLAILDQNMGEIYHYKGDLAEAIALYRKALAELRRLGDLRQQASVLIDISSLYRDEGSFAEAKEHAEKAVAIAEKVGDHCACGLALCAIADAEFRSGRADVATEHYQRAARIAAEIESPYLKACTLHGMAEVALRARRTEDARIFWRASYDIFMQLGVYEAATVALRLELIGDPVSTWRETRHGR